MRIMDLHFVLFVLPGFLLGLTAHEFAHAWTASLLGDDYPRRRGRVSLNPLRHLSLFGTLAILFLPIGWAKPVEINAYNFKHPKRDYLLSSLAGPAANILLVAGCLLAMQFTRRTYRFGLGGEPFLILAHGLLALGAIINSILAAVNLLPIPPLDGSKIWPFLFPRMQVAQGRGMVWVCIAALVFLAWTGRLGTLIHYMIAPAASLTPESDSQRYEAHMAAGVEAYDDGRLDRAEREFGHALDINEQSDEALAWRGIVRAARKNHAGALDDVLKAIELRPRCAVYHLQAADYFEALSDAKQADRHRKIAAAIDPSAVTRPTTAPATRPATQPATAPAR